MISTSFYVILLYLNHLSKAVTMSKWYQIFPKNTGLSIYIWIIFCLIPFYFLFKSSPTIDFFIGIIMVILFFIAYLLSFISDIWIVYGVVSPGTLIIMIMT